jgi:predicted acyltransferase
VWFPLNKKLWTSSYVLVAAGWSVTLLTLLYWAVEQKAWGKGRGKAALWPWLVFGSNAIVAYMFSELLASTLDVTTVETSPRVHESVSGLIFANAFEWIPNAGWAAFAFSVSFTAVCFVPVWLLYRKRIFVKV